MTTNKKKILLIFGLLIILIIVIFSKKFKNDESSNQISFDEIITENKISNTTTVSETIKVHITGEVNNPRINRTKCRR